MKKVFQTKLKSLTKVLTLVIIASLATFTGCKSYDEDITTLTNDVATLKSQLASLDTYTKAEIDAKITTLNGEIATLNTSLTALQNAGATDVELAALKTDIESRFVTKAALEAYQTQVSTDIAAAVAGLATKASVDAVNAEVVKVQTALTEFGIAVDKKIADLKTKDDELAAKVAIIDTRILTLEATVALNTTGVAANKTAIEDLVLELKALKESINVTKINEDLAALDKKIEDLAKNLGLDFAILSRQLSSLVLIPSSYINGIEAIDFSTLTAKCTSITPKVEVSYRVSPSNLKKEDIDFNNIKFYAKDAANTISLISGVNGSVPTGAIAVEFVELNNGVLKVRIEIPNGDYSKYFGGTTTATSETFTIGSLQVPISAKVLASSNTTIESGIVSSDYARLFSKVILASDLAIAKEATNYPQFPKTESAAKALDVKGVDGKTADDLTIVRIPYGTTKNLLDTVVSIYKSTNKLFEQSYYGLEFKFEEIASYIRVSNNTEQQEFINITDANKGTVQVKTYSQTEIEAAQGRTPIVKVSLVDPETSCTVDSAYIKLYLEEKPAKPALETYTYDLGNSDEICSGKSAMITTAQIMNEKYYNLAGLSKTEFHNVYNLTADAANLGTFSLVTDVADQTTSYLLKWEVSAATVLSKINNESTYTFTENAQFVPQSQFKTLYGPINVKVTYTVTRKGTVNVDEPNLIDGLVTGVVWTKTADGFGQINNNISIDDEIDPNLAVFDKKLDEAFKVNVLNSNLPDGHTYFFYATQPTLNLPTGTIKLVGSGSELKTSGGEVVAKIEAGVLKLQSSSDVAKKLLNKDVNNLKVNIGIATTYCDGAARKVTVLSKDYFIVNYIRPITINAVASKYFIDGMATDKPGTYIALEDLVTFKNWKNTSFVLGSTLSTYYGVGSPTVKLSDIETNIDGTYKKIADHYASNFTIGNPASINGVTPISTYGYLTYRNNNLTIEKTFQFRVPVVVTYTWGEITEYVTVDIKPTSQANVKRK